MNSDGTGWRDRRPEDHELPSASSPMPSGPPPKTIVAPQARARTRPVLVAWVLLVVASASLCYLCVKWLTTTIVTAASLEERIVGLKQQIKECQVIQSQTRAEITDLQKDLSALRSEEERKGH